MVEMFYPQGRVPGCSCRRWRGFRHEHWQRHLTLITIFITSYTRPIKLAILATLRRDCREGQDPRCSSSSLRAFAQQKLPLVHSLTLCGPVGQPGSRGSSRELVQEGLGEEGCGPWFPHVSKACSWSGDLSGAAVGFIVASLHERCSRAMCVRYNWESSPLTPGGLRLDPTS